MDLRRHKKGTQLAVRAGVGGILALAIAQLLNLAYPMFAFVAAVIVTDLSPAETRQLGVRRLVATLVGAVVGAFLSPLLPAGPVAVGVSVVVAMLVSEIVRAREGAKVAGFICGMIVLDQNVDPWHYAFFRSIETALGILVAWLISYVPKIFKTDEEEPQS